MRYKIRYQDNGKIKTTIIDKDGLTDIKNIISISPIDKQLTTLSSSFDPLSFFQELYSMLKANLDIVTALDLMKSNAKDDISKEIIIEISNTIQKNLDSLSTLKKYEKYLTKDALLLLNIGIKNTNIKEAIYSIVVLLEQTKTIKKKIKDTLQYPMVLLSSLFISIWIIFLYVVPNFKNSIVTKENIPFSTQLLFDIEHLISHYYIYILLSIIFFSIVSFIFYKKNKFLYDKITLSYIPIFSKVIQYYTYYKFFLSLYLALQAKYQFQIALQYSIDTVENIYLKEILSKILLDLKHGVSISNAFTNSKLFDKFTLKLIFIAEKTNNYDEIFNNILQIYKDKLTNSIKHLTTILEPTVIIIISTIVLWLIVAIMGPTWQLGSTL